MYNTSEVTDPCDDFSIILYVYMKDEDLDSEIICSYTVSISFKTLEKLKFFLSDKCPL